MTRRRRVPPIDCYCAGFAIAALAIWQIGTRLGRWISRCCDQRLWSDT